MTKGVTDRLSSSLNVDMGSPSTDPDANMERSDDLRAYESLMRALAEKFNDPGTSYAVKLQILTLSPFDVEKTMSKFCATRYMVKKARALRDEHGIMATPTPKKPRASLQDKVKDSVHQFFERDISRVCPGHLRHSRRSRENGKAAGRPVQPRAYTTRIKTIPLLQAARSDRHRSC